MVILITSEVRFVQKYIWWSNGGIKKIIETLVNSLLVGCHKMWYFFGNPHILSTWYPGFPWMLWRSYTCVGFGPSDGSPFCATPLRAGTGAFDGSKINRAPLFPSRLSFFNHETPNMAKCKVIQSHVFWDPCWFSREAPIPSKWRSYFEPSYSRSISIRQLFMSIKRFAIRGSYQGHWAKKLLTGLYGPAEFGVSQPFKRDTPAFRPSSLGSRVVPRGFPSKQGWQNRTSYSTFMTTYDMFVNVQRNIKAKIRPPMSQHKVCKKCI